jgi:hypothetical protein
MREDGRFTHVEYAVPINRGVAHLVEKVTSLIWAFLRPNPGGVPRIGNRTPQNFKAGDRLWKDDQRGGRAAECRGLLIFPALFVLTVFLLF